MHRDLRILGPVFLILLAGYFSTGADIFSDSPTPSLLTGAAITELNKCPADQVLFKVSGPANAHAELFNGKDYQYAVCWNGKTNSKSRTCTPDNVIVKLSAPTNAHVSQGDKAQYAHKVCYGNFNCEYTESSCSPGFTCIASLSSETNAHVGNCNAYSLKICCASSKKPKIDTDKDGVYDDGDGKGIGNNPCHPKRNKNFETCDDNCRVTPNPDQKDADGDGAGDVCDKFPNDSCSVNEQNDNCKNYNKCAKSLQAAWTTQTATEGNDVTLKVTGSSECNDETFVFRVFDATKSNIQTVDPEPATFTNGSATTKWQAEYHPSGTNKYTFQAQAQQNIQVSSPNNKLLTVTKDSSPSARCGDKKVQRSKGEQCDEGSKNCRYSGKQAQDKCSKEKTCDAKCKLIPGKDNNGNNTSCRTDPQCKGKQPGLFAVCDKSKPTQIRFCIRGAGGCLKLSTLKDCGKVGSTQKVCVQNAPACQSPTCDYSYIAGSCDNGNQEITCSATGGKHCTGCSGYPKTLACFEEPTEPFPFFSGWNVLVTLLLLTTFYGVSLGRRRLR